MSDVSKLKFENGSYNIKDTQARNDLSSFIDETTTNLNDLSSFIDETATNLNDLRDETTTNLNDLRDETTTNLNVLRDDIEEDISLKVDSSLLPIMFDGTKTLQETIEQAVDENRPIQIVYGEFEIDENVVVNCNNKPVTIRGYGMSQSYAISRLIFRKTGLGIQLINCNNLSLENCDFVTETVGESPYNVPSDKDFCTTSGNIRATNVFIRGFNIAFTWVGGYYHVFDRVIMSHMNIGFNNWSAYNVQFSQCNFRNFGTLFRASSGVGPLVFNQCVFEGFTQRVVESTSLQAVKCCVNIVNSYFENGGDREMPQGLVGTFGNAGIIRGCGPITFTGNFLHGNNLSRVIWLTSTNKSLVSKNNTYNFPETAINVAEYIFFDLGQLDWADISDTVEFGVTTTTFGSTLAILVAKGTSRIYNMFTKTMETTT